MYSSRDTVYAIDPLLDPRWEVFVDRHPHASVFHTREWLRALESTYGYEPVALTMSPPSEALTNAVLCCLVRSWLTGNRLVSLPFSDHCEPLVDHPEAFDRLTTFMDEIRSYRGWKYIEMRSASSSLEFGTRFTKSKSYCLHRLDLRPSLEALYRNFHKDCIQRKIHRAGREGLSYESGYSKPLLSRFYRLLLLTRARHQLPPQPIEWFENLVDCMGEKVCIRIASKAGEPVAGVLTLRHGGQLIYKYGASDANRSNLGGTAMLFWSMIQEAKQSGIESLDLGRSDLNNTGLIAFKERWGATSSTVITWRSPVQDLSPRREELKLQCARELVARMPERLSVLAGRLLYRHIG
ncbi:MAG: GNAT family N-acetyltransferase [Nitrospira sp.]